GATDPGVAPTLRKPRISYLIATACGLGYLKPAPGTWGSLAGVLAATAPLLIFRAAAALRFGVGLSLSPVQAAGRLFDPFVVFQIAWTATIAVAGVWAANRVAAYSRMHDPQFVVIDEVSGQQLTLLLGGFATPRGGHIIQGLVWANHPLAVFGSIEPNWKYFLAGFILFRAFDIWKPFPVRQAESLPGGLGIMADDWAAALYAAAGLWIARWLGL
ncbi:MAG: phosphatidylglycerophosphatase A, partial [Candidatus Acidiferrales bacterium]